MSDFTQTMKDWRRMCNAHDHCCGCRLNFLGDDCLRMRLRMQMDYERVLNAVSQWVAEHPEPQYPTWGEWFEAQGELTAEWRNVRVVSNMGTGVIGVLYQRIPADIAEKLGIEPKEEKNNG